MYIEAEGRDKDTSGGVKDVWMGSSCSSNRIQHVQCIWKRKTCIRQLNKEATLQLLIPILNKVILQNQENGI